MCEYIKIKFRDRIHRFAINENLYCFIMQSVTRLFEYLAINVEPIACSVVDSLPMKLDTNVANRTKIPIMACVRLGDALAISFLH